MASKFNLTAQLSLAPPTNVPQIVRQVNSQLQGITMQINPNVNAKSLNQANTAVQKVGVSAKVTSKNLNTAAGSANSLGSALGAAARRFASITLATGFFLALTRALGSAVGRSIEFEREMLKISQVTGKTIRGLRDLSGEVTRLSTTLGVSSEELLNAARTLSQAGFAAEKVTGALKILAQTDLAATFDNIKDTTEGAIAILSQFRAEVRAAGGEVQFLEKAMDAINSVSKNFAVESADLISVVRRTGGVFEAAGGKLNELIALFTSVRATTRETADTIATGFRTIFTRIQRTETIDSLRELGIVLQDTEGRFVGPMEAIARLSAGLKALDPRDFRFTEIVEQLGGFRQIGKVIPLIKQYQTSTEALAVANNSLGSTASDAAIAQQGLGNQFAQLKEKFDATVRSLAGSDTFQTLATSAIKMAEAILKIVESLEPLLPMLTALAAFKLGSIAVPALGRFAGVGGRHEGGKVHGFAGGGMVPGRGNRDTVPAMLQPGEFVMRKSAVKKIGADNMAEMNNGYAAGGIVTGTRRFYQRTPTGTVRPNRNTAGIQASLTAEDRALLLAAERKKAGEEVGEEVRAIDMIKMADVKFRPGAKRAGGFSLQERTDSTIAASNFSLGQVPASKFTSTTRRKIAAEIAAKSGEELAEVEKLVNSSTFKSSLTSDATFPVSSLKPAGLREATEAGITNMAKSGLSEGVDTVLKGAMGGPGGAFLGALRQGGAKINNQQAGIQLAADNQAVSSMEGFLFEGVVSGITGAIPSGDTKNFDLLESEVSANQEGLASVFSQAAVSKMKMAELKRSSAKLPMIRDKLASHASKTGYTDKTSGIQFQDVVGFAQGGKPKGTDTVPAMLTPGEFVLQKSAAQGVGYSNLHRMNQSNGVNGYAAGGIVTGTRGNYGTMPGGGGGASIGTIPGIESASKGFTKLAQEIGALVGQLIRAGEAITLGANSATEKLIQGANVLGSELSAAGNAFIGLPTTVLNLLDDGAVQLGTGLADAAKGMSSIDNIMIEALTASLTPFTAAIADASKGISTVDNIMKNAMTGAMAPLKGSLSLLDGEFKTFGKELKLKLKFFDVLKKANTDLVVVMENLGKALMEKADDFNILKPPLASVEASLVALSTIVRAQDQLFVPLRSAVWNLSSALQNQAKQMGSKGGGMSMVAISGPMQQMAMNMSLVAKRMSNIVIISGHLQAAMGRMIEALNLAGTNIGQTGGASLGPAAELKRLEKRILALEGKIKALESAAQGAAGKLNQTKTPMATGAAGGAGMSNMANQAMMAAMMIGMMVTQMGSFDRATEAAINASVMLGSIFGMIALEVANVISAKIAEVTASLQAAGSLNAMSMSAMKASIASAGLSVAMIGLSVAVAVVTFWYMKASEEAKEMSSKMAEAIKDIAAGTSTMGAGEVESGIGAAMQKEAEASMGVWTAIKAAGIAAAVVIAAVVIGLVTLGTGLVLAAGAAAAAGAAGYSLGESMATVDEKLLLLSVTLGLAAREASVGLNELAQSRKRVETVGLEGGDKLKEQISGGAAVVTGGDAAFNAMVLNEQALIAMTDAEREAAANSETHTKMMEANAEALQATTKAGYEQAAAMKQTTSQMASDMISSGKTIDEVMNDPQMVAGFKQIKDSVFAAAKAAEMNTASTEAEAKARLGLENVTADELTQRDKSRILAMKARVAAEKAEKQSNEVTEAHKNRIRADDAADKKAKAAAAVSLAANMKLAEEANKAAVAINNFSVAMISVGQSFSMFDMELASLTGSIKEYKSVNAALIGTLKSGNVTTESAAAARDTGTQFGLDNEVNALLRNMEENERIRTVLLDKGLDGLKGGLDEKAANLQLDQFFKDNNIDLSGVSQEIRDEIRLMLEDGLQADEVQKITDLLNAQNEGQIKVLQDLAKAQEKYLSGLFKFGGAVVKAQNAYASSLRFLTDVQLKGAERMAKAEGRELSVREVRAAGVRKRGAGMGAVGLVGAGVQGTVVQLQGVTKKLRQAEEDVNNLIKIGSSDENIIKLQNEQKQLANQSKVLRENLKKLADQADLAAAIMGEIDKERGKRDTIRGLISEFTFASNQGRKDMDRNFMALQRVMQTGNLNSIPDEMRSAVGGLLSTLEDIAIGPQGQTGGQIKKMLEMQMANQLKIRATGRPLTAEEMQKIFNKTTKEEKLINDLRDLNAVEQAAAQALANQEAADMQTLIAALNRLVTALENAKLEAGQAAGPAMAARGGWIGFDEGGGATSTQAGAATTTFTPQGTDTVPAMLTPGEFVVNRKAAQRNAGALQSINSGKVQYLQAGGWADQQGYDPKAKQNPMPHVNQFWADMAIGSELGRTGGDIFISKEGIEKDLGPEAAAHFENKKTPGDLQYIFSPGLQRLGVKEDKELFNRLSEIHNLGPRQTILTAGVAGVNKGDVAAKATVSVARNKQDSFNYLMGHELMQSHGNEGDTNTSSLLSKFYAVGGGFTQYTDKPLLSSMEDWNKYLNETDREKFDAHFDDRYSWTNQALRERRDEGLYDWLVTKIAPGTDLLGGEQEKAELRFWDTSLKVRENIKKAIEAGKGQGGVATQYWGDIAGFKHPRYNQGFNGIHGDFIRPRQGNFIEDFVTMKENDASFQQFFVKPDGYKWKEMLEGDPMSYIGRGFATHYNRNTGYKEIGLIKDNVMGSLRNTYAKYSYDLKKNVTQEGSAGYKDLENFYKNFASDNVVEKDGAKASLNKVIASIAAMPQVAPDVPFMELPGVFLDVMRAAQTSVDGGNGPDIAKYGEDIRARIGYVPWDADGLKEMVGLNPDTDAKAGIARAAINNASGVLKGIAGDSTPDKVAAALDNASTILRGAPAQGGLKLLAAIKALQAADPAQAPEVVEEVQNINAAEVIEKIKSPFMTDEAKAATIEAAHIANLKWRVPNYARDTGVIPESAKSIRQLQVDPKNFDAIFPYFKGLGEQVKYLINRGAIVGADADGISIDPAALSFGVKSLGAAVPGVPQILSVPPGVKDSLFGLNHWSSNSPPFWIPGHKVSRDEKMLMHQFFGMGNVEHTLAAMQADARIALTELAMRDFGDYNGFDILKAAGLDILDIGHLDPAGRGDALKAQLKELQGFKAGLVQQRADAQKPQQRASGGPIDWSPRGTDTVPAMLTPGEFVMRKSAVDKYGMGFMSAINEGRGGSGGYMHEGGVASVSQFGPQEDLRIDRVLSNTESTSKAVNKIGKDLTGTAKQTDLEGGFNQMVWIPDAIRNLIDASDAYIVSQLQTILNTIDDIQGGLAMDQQSIIDAVHTATGPVHQQLDDDHQMLKNMHWWNNGASRQNFTTLANAIPAMVRPFNPAGPPQFMATGGMARGTDTVPAMLTPGEFVMKKSAVDKYGVGFMRSLNNGASPTSRSRGVQYLQNGDLATSGGGNLFAGVGDIVSSISDSLSAFTQAFSLFSGLSSMLSNTINSMADMNITHNININGSVNIPGFSKRAVKKIINAVVEEVVDDVDAKINQAFAERDRDNENRTD